MDKETRSILELLAMKQLSVQSVDRILRALELFRRREDGKEPGGVTLSPETAGHRVPADLHQNTSQSTRTAEEPFPAKDFVSAIHKAPNMVDEAIQMSEAFPVGLTAAEERQGTAVVAKGRVDIVDASNSAKPRTRKYHTRMYIYIIRSLITLGFVCVIFLSTYMMVSYNYGLRVKEVKDKLSMEIHEKDKLYTKIYEMAAKAERFEKEVEEYRDLVSAFSRKGKRKSLGTFTVTAYDPIESCKPFDDGMTSQLIPAGMGVAAVDPRVIPYGSVLYIPDIGKYFFACDTGTAIKQGNGRNIDILMPTVQDALEFGRQRLQVELIDLSRG